MPDKELPIERLDLPDERMELIGQEHHCILRHIRQHCTVCLPDTINEIAAAAYALGRNEPKLRTVAADRVDQHRALAYQQFA